MSRMILTALTILLSSMMAVPSAAQDSGLSLGAPFSDGMVLQRGQVVPVWGKGKSGTEVRVQLEDDVSTATVRADGSWQVEFAPRDAAKGLTLAISNAGKLTELTDIAMGDVYLCSGQSNMAWKMSASALRPEDRNPEIDAQIRLLTVPAASAQVEQRAFGATAVWSKATKDWLDFSAVCLFTGREIAESEGVTVGLINSSWGGTPIRAWLPYESLALAGGMEDRLAVLDAFRRDPVSAEVEHGAVLYDLWNNRPSPARSREGREGYANLFNGMMAPLGPTRFSGAIWYQGENNANNAEGTVSYRNLLDAMISGWRARFGERLPFVVVQLAGYGKLAKEPDNDDWADVREAQRLAARDDPMTELVVTIDIGERLNIHPPIKKPVGQRAAAALLKIRYGKTDAYRPPEAKSARRVGNEIEIIVSHEQGLLFAASWGRPGPFLLCEDAKGERCRFADAQFSEAGVRVTVPKGSEPIIVRYCWDTAPICNVFDQTEMPLGPFELTIEQ